MKLPNFQSSRSPLWVIGSFILLLYFSFTWILPWLAQTSVLLSYPFDWDLYEGLSAYAATQIQNHTAMYKDPFTFPLVSYPYPPLYPFLLSLYPSEAAADLLIFGRVLSFVSFLGILAIVYKILRSLGIERRWIAVALLFIASTSDVVSWLPLSRVDYPYIFLILLGMATSFSLHSKQSKYEIRFGISLTLFSIATLMKHTAILYALTLIALVLFHRERRTRILSIVAVWILGSFLILKVLDGSFYSSLIQSRFEDISWTRVRVFLSSGLKEYPLIFLGLFGWAFWGKRKGYSNPAFVFACLSLSLVILAGHRGSSVNYMIPTILFLAMGLSLGFHLLPLSRSLSAGLALLLCLGHLVLGEPYRNFRAPTPEGLGKMRAVVAFLKLSPQAPWVDGHPMLSLLSGHDPVMDLDATRDRFWFRYGQGEWKTRLEKVVNQEKAPTFILAGPRLQGLKFSAIDSYYLVGEVTIETWYGQDKLLGLVRKDQITRLPMNCVSTHRDIFQCLSDLKFKSKG